MTILVFREKQRCSVCNKKFYPKYCKICRHRDFTACPECHNNGTYHRRRVHAQFS